MHELAGIYVLCVEHDELVRASNCARFKSHGILHAAVETHAQLCALLPHMERVPTCCSPTTACPKAPQRSASQRLVAIHEVIGACRGQTDVPG